VKDGGNDGGDVLRKFAAMAVGVGVLGLGAAYVLPGDPQGRLAAFIGVAGAVFSGVLALTLKRRALARSVQGALAVVGVVFGIRMVLVVVGLLYVVRADLGTMAFTLGFFGVYFPLQWIEVGYVLAETKRRGHGGA
jgi:hypothetical protein